MQIRNGSALKDLDHEGGFRDLSDVWKVYTTGLGVFYTTIPGSQKGSYIGL